MTILVSSVKQVPVGLLVEYPGNPRHGDIPTIAASLEANGQFRPLVVQRQGNVVLAGNHTLQAAVKLGWKKIAVTYVEVDDDTARRIVLADNRSSDLGSYDDRALADLLAEVGSLDGTGFDDGDLERLLSKLTPPSASGEEAGQPEGDEEPETRMWVGHFQLVFDTEEQRATWNAYLRWLRGTYPDAETNTDRIISHLLSVTPELLAEVVEAGHYIRGNAGPAPAAEPVEA